MKRVWLIVGFCCLLASPVISAEEDVKRSIRDAVIANLNASQKEDVVALMKTLHKDSPVLETTRLQSQQVFSLFRLKYKVHAIDLVGTAGEFAFARVDLTTSGVEGPAFRDNRATFLYVFKKQRDQWKYWNQLLLEIQFLKK